jgi:hypothetical protein
MGWVGGKWKTVEAEKGVNKTYSDHWRSVDVSFNPLTEQLTHNGGQMEPCSPLI